MASVTVSYKGNYFIEKINNVNFLTKIYDTIKFEECHSINIEGFESLDIWKIKRMARYDSLHEQAKRRMWQVILTSIAFMVLDIVLFFVLPHVLAQDLSPKINFSPIPIGATIGICGIQAGCIAVLFSQYKEESRKAAYIFRGKGAFPNVPDIS